MFLVQVKIQQNQVNGSPVLWLCSSARISSLATWPNVWCYMLPRSMYLGHCWKQKAVLSTWWWPAWSSQLVSLWCWQARVGREWEDWVLNWLGRGEETRDEEEAGGGSIWQQWHMPDLSFLNFPSPFWTYSTNIGSICPKSLIGNSWAHTALSKKLYLPSIYP